jgi:hypothetical protein
MNQGTHLSDARYKRLFVLIGQALARMVGVNIQNNGVPLAGGPFMVIDFAPGLTATNEGGGVVRVTPAPVAGVDVAGLYACAPGAVAVGQAVKMTGSATCALAQADTAADVAVGICSQVLNPALVLITYNGEVSGFVGLVPDTEYYLDPAVAGGVTAVAPSTPGQIVQIMGRAKTAAILAVEVTGEFDQL